MMILVCLAIVAIGVAIYNLNEEISELRREVQKGLTRYDADGVPAMGHSSQVMEDKINFLYAELQRVEFCTPFTPDHLREIYASKEKINAIEIELSEQVKRLKSQFLMAGRL